MLLNTQFKDGAMLKGSFLARSLEDRLYDENSISEITTKSKAQYLKKFETIKRHAHNLGLDDSYIDLKNTVNILLNKNDISLATAKFYRATILFQIYHEALNAIAANEDIEYFKDVYDQIRDWTIADPSLVKKPVGTEKRTSSNKTKYFDKQFYDYCIENLGYKLNPIRTRRSEKSTDKYNLLFHFLKLNMQLGLRPIEWFGAAPATYLQTQKGKIEKLPAPSLVIQNAKNTNGRANGVTREILLTGFNLEQLKAVNDYLFLLRKYRHTSYDETLLLRAMSRTLKTLCEQYIKENPNLSAKIKDDIENTTLYTTRHQAINNAKMSGYSRGKIAAMFGHVSTSTQSKHYGQKGKGWLKLAAQPTLETILAVRTNSTRTKHVANPGDPSLNH